MITLYIILGLIALVILYVNSHPVFGGKIKGDVLERVIKSSNYKNDGFVNLEYTPVQAEDLSMLKTMKEFIKGPENGKPDSVETVKFDKSRFLYSDSGITVTWFGHSTVLLNINGKVILIDPVFSKYASPLPFSNKSFKYTNPFSVQDLPNIDFLVISHDHYDHLDYKTIKKLKKKVKRYYVPVGVDAHLLRWGVEQSKIVVADWWDEFKVEPDFTFVATPARHFSGRGFKRNNTLWCSWVIKTSQNALFFGGDSGYGDHFKAIGEKYGPFDLSLLECGQYNQGWPYIHTMPEETIQAHLDVKGENLMAIHWGKFKLSLHSWTEPIERARNAAQTKHVRLIEPKIGEVYVLK